MILLKREGLFIRETLLRYKSDSRSSRPGPALLANAVEHVTFLSMEMPSVPLWLRAILSRRQARIRFVASSKLHCNIHYDSTGAQDSMLQLLCLC